RRALAQETERRRVLEKAERLASVRADVASRHLARLQRVTAALSEAASTADVTRVVLEQIPEVVGATAAKLASPATSAAMLRISAVGPRGGECTAYAPLDAENPLSAAFRTRGALWLRSGAAIAESFPG